MTAEEARDEEWRHWAITTLAEDMPAAFPGGPSHRAGSRIHLASLTRDRFGRVIAFTMPAPSALALSISISSAIAADRLHREIEFVPGMSPIGRSRMVSDQDTGRLYDFFENCMTSVTFSVNSLEVYCNQIVADMLPSGSQYRRERGAKVQLLTGAQVQRTCFLEEKISVVLPALLSVSSPHESKGLWSAFLRLKQVRNSTIHMKAEEAYRTDPDKIETGSLFHEFIAATRITSFPLVAVELLRALQPPNSKPLWLMNPEQRLADAARMQR